MKDINVNYEGEKVRVEYIDGEDFHGRWTPEIEDVYNEDGKSIMDEIEDIDDIYILMDDAFAEIAEDFRIEKEARRFEDHKERKYRSI